MPKMHQGLHCQICRPELTELTVNTRRETERRESRSDPTGASAAILQRARPGAGNQKRPCPSGTELALSAPANALLPPIVALLSGLSSITSRARACKQSEAAPVRHRPRAISGHQVRSPSTSGQAPGVAWAGRERPAHFARLLTRSTSPAGPAWPGGWLTPWQDPVGGSHPVVQARKGPASAWPNLFRDPARARITPRSLEQPGADQKKAASVHQNWPGDPEARHALSCRDSRPEQARWTSESTDRWTAGLQASAPTQAAGARRMSLATSGNRQALDWRADTGPGVQSSGVTTDVGWHRLRPTVGLCAVIPRWWQGAGVVALQHSARLDLRTPALLK